MVENLLRDFGLTEYEIRAFTTLLKLKIATAEQLSEAGKIPLPRVYDTLTELKKKGFVLVTKTRPKKFRPISTEKALKNLIKIKKNGFEEKIKNLEKTAKDIVKTVSKIPTEKIEMKKEYLWSIEKRKNIANILDEQKEMAKKEILIFSGDMSWLTETMKIIKQSIKDGIKIRAVTYEPENKKWLKNIKLAKKIGIDVRTGYKGLMRGHIIDNKVVSIATKQSSKGLNVAGGGKPGSDILSRYELITSGNPILVKSLKENFEFWWKRLK